jgi:GNAT superfamily N-acetyltransferase
MASLLRRLWRRETTVAQPIISVTDAPSPAAGAAIYAGLIGYNDGKVGQRDGRALAVLVSDPATGAVVGGLTGHTWCGAMVIDYVFLPERLRGRGIGTAMLREAEDEARRRGCCSAVLCTMSFQAPGFYARCGWEKLGRIPSHPSGTERIYFTKEFASAMISEPPRGGD